ncbi:SDR family oxidoreductase [Bradyrhizobium sp. BRP56]|nr:SDR family oxidoreductase [Bradyrhizobium sp. BRP56]
MRSRTSRSGRSISWVNNAGVAEPIVRTIDQKLSDWERVMDVNLRGTFLACRASCRAAAEAPSSISARWQGWVAFRFQRVRRF